MIVPEVHVLKNNIKEGKLIIDKFVVACFLTHAGRWDVEIIVGEEFQFETLHSQQLVSEELIVHKVYSKSNLFKQSQSVHIQY